MYLSRLILNARERDARRSLADCQVLHQLIMRGFPNIEASAAREELGILFRVEPMRQPPRLPILVQSLIPPRWPAGGAILSVNEARPLEALIAGLESGREYRFTLTANPTRKIDTKTGPDGVRRHGRRVELCDDTSRLAWLARRAEAAGFEILNVAIDPALPDVLTGSAHRLQGRRVVQDASHRLTLVGVRFDGRLRVLDVDRIRHALATGIGPGKAYGCGLLSIAPWRPYDDQRPAHAAEGPR